MGIENIRKWLTAEAESRAGIELRPNSTEGTLARINSVSITGLQLRGAFETVEHLQIRSEADAIRHGIILADFARQLEIAPTDDAGPSFHARVLAMLRWKRQYDPQDQTNIEAFFEASARCPLIETDHGMAFDPESFAELIYFIAELPF